MLKLLSFAGSKQVCPIRYRGMLTRDFIFRLYGFDFGPAAVPVEEVAGGGRIDCYSIKAGKCNCLRDHFSLVTSVFDHMPYFIEGILDRVERNARV